MLEDQDMSVQEAAAVVQDARARARKELVISAPLVYAAWGLVWLIGYGAMWLSVRGQHPYTGPSGVSIAAVFVLAGFAAAAVLVIASKAIAGIDGQSVRYRRIILTTWATGYLILLIVQAEISGSVSTRALAFVGFAGPLLLAGLTYILCLRPRTELARVRPRRLASARRRRLRMAGTRDHGGGLRAGGRRGVPADVGHRDWAPRACPLRPGLTPSFMGPRGCVSW